MYHSGAVAKKSAHNFDDREECAYPLELIVDGTPDVFVCVPNRCHHIVSCLSLVDPESKAIPQSSDSRFPFKGGKACLQHQLNGANQLVGMWPNGKERFDS